MMGDGRRIPCQRNRTEQESERVRGQESNKVEGWSFYGATHNACQVRDYLGGDT